MTALILSTQLLPEQGVFDGALCSPLSPLVDRPFLQHAVESVMDAGIRNIDFVVRNPSQSLESLLGSGQRWGGDFRYHDAVSAGLVDSLAVELIAGLHEDERILLGRADCIPDLSGWAQEAEHPNFIAVSADGMEWLGWAALPVGVLQDDRLRSGQINLSAFVHQLFSLSSQPVRRMKPLTVRTCEELILAHHRVLRNEFPRLLLTGTQVEEHLWIGRNVRIHRTARLVPPVHIGENCRIGAYSQVGPNASVGKGCVIDRTSHVSNSVIFSGSYVGEGLEVRHALVNGNHLVNTRIGAAVLCMDEILLGNVNASFKPWLLRTRDSLLAAIFLMIGFPLFALLSLWIKASGVKRQLCLRQYVRQPSLPYPESWKYYSLPALQTVGVVLPNPFTSHLITVFLPGLWQVLCRRLQLAGSEPLTTEAALLMPEEIRISRLRSIAGLISGSLWEVRGAYLTNRPTPRSRDLLSRYFREVWRELIRPSRKISAGREACETTAQEKYESS